MFVLYLVKTSDASERTQRRRPLPVRLLIEPKCRTFFKSLFKLLTLQPLSENSRINFITPQNMKFCINCLSKCEFQRRLIAVICSGLHRRVIDEATDHVAWTAARLCEN